MKKLLFVCLFSQTVICHAQFNSDFEIEVSDTLRMKSIEWIDADNDSLLDVAVVAKTTDSTFAILFYENIEGNEFTYSSFTKTNFTQFTYGLADFNRDNQIDFVVSGITSTDDKQVTVLLNKGEFIFEQLTEPLLQTYAEVVAFGDLDVDGRLEVILSGGDIGKHTNIYKNKDTFLELYSDTIALRATTVIVEDFDGNMFKDVFVTGEDESNTLHSAILFNNGLVSFQDTLVAEAFEHTKAITADINYDGFSDIIVAGKNSSTTTVKFFVSNGIGGFTEKDSLVSNDVKQLFAADLNSDGRIDLNMLGVSTSGQLVNHVKFSDNTILNIETDGVIRQKFGDVDRDGDLDLLQLKRNEIVLQKNSAAVNVHPGMDQDPFGTWIYDRFFGYWDKSGDDHTPANSISYDVVIHSLQEEVVIGDFDLMNKRRMLVSQGNNGMQNFFLLKNIPQGSFELEIQSVDNSLHAGAIGICRGNGSCALESTEIITCGEEIIQLTTEKESLWFSFANGYLGEFTQYSYDEASTDTLFAFTPEENPTCASLKIFVIDHNKELIKKETTTQYVCENAVLEFTVEDDWEEITWSSTLHGTISHEPGMSYTVTEPDVVLVELSDGFGCHLQRETTLVISEPVLTLSGETYQVLKGESVQLEASGGETYSWQPPTGLSNTAVPNPVATPTVTTEYAVTTYDSIGCSDQGKVLIIVEETAFIPNLFTPNDDGKNDALKVYGLSQVQSFSFAIFNRDGSKVYSTKNIQDVAGTGWNGTVNGVLQPPGVYYWKVEGEHNGGKRVLLNGKETGSIILIR